MKCVTITIFAVVLVSVSILMLPVAAYAQDLLIQFDKANAKPYAFIENKKLVAGIIKDIGDELAKELGIDVHYINVPRKRVEQFLGTGEVHATLISNPAWYPESKYNWTIPLYRESDIFLVSAQRAFPINTYDDLKGKHVGTIRGYHYPGLQEKFDRQEVIRHDVSTFEQNVKKLETGRIDCLINANILIDYYLKEHNAHKQFVIGGKVVSTHDIHGMFSKQAPIPIDRINAAIRKMNKNGKITEILERYK